MVVALLGLGLFYTSGIFAKYIGAAYLSISMLLILVYLSISMRLSTMDGVIIVRHTLKDDVV